MKRILVFFGGCSTEYAVSLESASAILTHMDKSCYQPLMVGITRKGEWLYYMGQVEDIAQDNWQGPQCIPCTLIAGRGARQLLLLDGTGRRLEFDAAFPVLHGKNGEDGTLQGLLELADIPIVGCGTLSSALCMDKDRSHKLAELAGVRVPHSVLLRRGVKEQCLIDSARQLGYPIFVKPVRAGSSFGITKVTRPEELASAAAEAFAHDREILLEEAIPGFEVGCAVLGNETLTVGLVDEIQLSQGFFNYEEKYTLKSSSIHCPARIPAAKAAQVQAAARRIYRALDCRVFARVDFFLTPAGEIIFNEVNTIPGFTSHSRYPTMMKGIGLDFPALVSRILALGTQA